jgi:hypothetical protein
MTWIQIGAMAGPTIELPSVALRSANFRLQGNGQGVLSTTSYLAGLPSLITEINSGSIRILAREMPLSQVKTAWLTPDAPGERDANGLRRATATRHFEGSTAC